MRLEPGLTLAVAPRFHCRPEWDARLRLNGGLVRAGAVLQPRDDWRAPDRTELQMLLGEGSPPATASSGRCLLLNIPEHLRLRWWDIAAHDDAGVSSGYESFVADVLALLRFKGLPVPSQCTAAAIVSRPDQRTTRLDATGAALAGFGFGSLAGTGSTPSETPQAVINLGDEPSHIVVLNLGVDELRARCPDTEDLLLRFAERAPDYPLARIALAPGEGLWLPSPAPAFDGWSVGKQDLDVILAIDGSRRDGD